MRVSQPTSESLDTLSASALVWGLADEDCAMLFECAEERHFDANETMIRQGDPADSLLLIVEGTAYARVRTPAGETHVIGEFEANHIIGEMALLTREPRSADIIARTPLRALALPSKQFLDMAADRPQLAGMLANIVADRLGRSSHDGLRGKQLDRFRIHRCIGRGAHAMVYEAEDIESGEVVALKMMSHRLIFDPDALRRFQSEADILQRLEHPNVARVHGRFQAYRTYFLVMEFCDGNSLSTLIMEHAPVDAQRARNIVGQLATGLVYIHGEDVLHRDLKPSNAMLTRDNVVKLMDFGLARNLDVTLELTRTEPDRLVGTPLYMAPELFTGSEPDRAADIYALACIAHELFLGKKPFAASDLLELILAKREFVLPEGSALGVDVPEDVHDFLKRGLQQQPKDRNVSLEAIAAWAT